MRSILVVDDEHDILLALELILSEEGFQVIKAHNGREALARLAEVRPAMVLLDSMMPVMSGLETIKAMKADPEYSRIPIVLMSAVAPRVSRDEYPWDVFLRKPFEIEGLMSVIHAVIGPAK